MQDPDSRIPGGQIIGQAAGAVGRVVIDDQERCRGQGSQDGGDHRADVLGLVVGREHDPDTGAEPFAGAQALGGCPRTCRS